MRDSVLTLSASIRAPASMKNSFESSSFKGEERGERNYSLLYITVHASDFNVFVVFHIFEVTPKPQFREPLETEPAP